MTVAAASWRASPAVQPKGPCRNCGVRLATAWWTADGGTLAFVHGMVQAWCERCCVEKQIEHAEEVAARRPKMQLDRERMKLLEVLGRKAAQ
jgi:hypothetical protein